MDEGNKASHYVVDVNTFENYERKSENIMNNKESTYNLFSRGVV